MKYQFLTKIIIPLLVGFAFLPQFLRMRVTPQRLNPLRPPVTTSLVVRHF
jgi:hypothetical protein